MDPSLYQIARYLNVNFSIDLWELPQSELTSTLTDNTEKNFYSRCPPEKRPRFMVTETQMHEMNISPTISTASDSRNEHTVEDRKQEYDMVHMEKVCSFLPGALSVIT